MAAVLQENKWEKKKWKLMITGNVKGRKEGRETVRCRCKRVLLSYVNLFFPDNHFTPCSQPDTFVIFSSLLNMQSHTGCSRNQRVACLIFCSIRGFNLIFAHFLLLRSHIRSPEAESVGVVKKRVWEFLFFFIEGRRSVVDGGSLSLWNTLQSRSLLDSSLGNLVFFSFLWEITWREISQCS